jgi:hypothetical protein
MFAMQMLGNLSVSTPTSQQPVPQQDFQPQNQSTHLQQPHQQPQQPQHERQLDPFEQQFNEVRTHLGWHCRCVSCMQHLAAAPISQHVPTHKMHNIRSHAHTYLPKRKSSTFSPQMNDEQLLSLISALASMPSSPEHHTHGIVAPSSPGPLVPTGSLGAVGLQFATQPVPPSSGQGAGLLDTGFLPLPPGHPDQASPGAAGSPVVPASSHQAMAGTAPPGVNQVVAAMLMLLTEIMRGYPPSGKF